MPPKPLACSQFTNRTMQSDPEGKALLSQWGNR